MLNLYDVYKSVFKTMYCEEWKFTIDYIRERTICDFGIDLNDNYSAILLTCVLKYNDLVDQLKSEKYNMDIDDYINVLTKLGKDYLETPLKNIGIENELNTNLFKNHR